MRDKLKDHAYSYLFILITFTLIIYHLDSENEKNEIKINPEVSALLEMDNFDLTDPIHRQLFRDIRNSIGEKSDSANEILNEADRITRERFTDKSLKKGAWIKGITWEKSSGIILMFLKFCIIYILVLFLTYYGSQTLGLYRFIRYKQRKESFLAMFIEEINRALKTPGSFQNFSIYLKILKILMLVILRGAAYLILFAPAYVIAYSFKTKFDTDSIFFMVILGTVSNGLLINFANRFYTYLITESKKGYIETAAVKNLSSSYSFSTKGPIRIGSIFRIRKMFPGHLLDHIYTNSKFQYFPSLKEQSSFLITGLIIIEMALNIQGHLFYELLQNILYKDYSVVLFIVLLVFTVVKFSELIIDSLFHLETVRYENSDK